MLEKYINNENRNFSFSKKDIFYLAFLIILGTVIRLFYHHNRPFIGDEVGTLIYMERSVSFILSHFESWLTMNYFVLAEKVLLWLGKGNQQVLVLVPELAGIATVPLTAILAKMVASKKVALISATLVTFNPYLIAFSGVIRAYSLLTAFSLLTVIFFFNWYRNRTFKNGIYLSLTCYFLMLSHLNGAYTLALIFFLIGLEFLYTFKEKGISNLVTLLIPLSVALIITMISYIKLIDDIVAWGIRWHDVPPTSMAYIPYAFSSYFGNGFYGWLSAILMGGAILLTFRAQKSSLILTLHILLPIVLISIQGISHFPWAYARFLIFLVPICIIFIAEGIEHLWLFMPMRNSAIIASIVILVIITWFPNLEEGYNKKIDQPWKAVATYIETTPNANLILSNDWLDNLHLRPYFDDTSYIQTQLTSYTEEQHAKVTGENVYFVVTNAEVSSNYPVANFGDIQVIIYPKTTYTHQLEIIQDDLLKRVIEQEVSPELTEVYQNLWILNTKLNGNPAENQKYFDLYMRCLQLTTRQRNIPLPLQYVELENSGYKINTSHNGD